MSANPPQSKIQSPKSKIRQPEQPPPLRLLARIWLEELQQPEPPEVAALPELAAALPGRDAAALTELAVAFQDLFGFQLPPYESVFVDPSAMLLAPATARVQALYRDGSWTPPAARVAAPDHLGLELLALSDWLAAGRRDAARRLQREHLALWAPVFLLTLRRLEPPTFYDRLAELTLAAVLETLPVDAQPPGGDPFPDLPPPPIYRASEPPEPGGAAGPGPTPEVSPRPPGDGLAEVVARLLSPRRAGLYLTRIDVSHLAAELDLPGGFGERRSLLATLFRSAGQYDLVAPLLAALDGRLAAAEADYAATAAAFPGWKPYALAWGSRLADTRQWLAELAAEAEGRPSRPTAD
jgi:TorA maturation chaperone TorD